MEEKRILNDEKLMPDKQYRYFFSKVYIPSMHTPQKFEEQGQEIINQLKYKYSLTAKMRVEWLGEINAEFSLLVIFHKQYPITVFQFGLRVTEEMLGKGWILEVPAEIYDPINPVEPPAATPPAEKGSLANVIQAVKDFYEENKGLCWLAAGAFAFLLLMIALSGRSEE